MSSARPATAHHFAVDPANHGQRLDVYMAGALPGLSRSQAQRLIRQGDVTVNGRPARPSVVLDAGDAVQVQVPPPLPDTPIPEDIPLSVLYDDTDIAVVEKPAGMVVHPAAGHHNGTLVNALLFHLRGLSGIGGRSRPGIVHRLDRGTSGVMVIAKHDTAHQHLSKQFHDRTVHKVYTALVWGRPEPGQVFDRAIGRDPNDRQKISSRGRRTRSAFTRVDRVEPLNGVSLVDVTIGSGRTHQIRVHLSEAGYPVVGDTLYGGQRRRGGPPALAKLERPFLHASRLSFEHPVDGRPLSFESPLPRELRSVVDLLRQAPKRRRGADTPIDRGPSGDARDE
jgi:23S rRNA pseudouridine1911/1915/1917 synthase